MTHSNSPDAFTVALESGQSVTALHYSAAEPASGGTWILAHGAGAGQQHPFMTACARAVAAAGGTEVFVTEDSAVLMMVLKRKVTGLRRGDGGSRRRLLRHTTAAVAVAMRLRGGDRRPGQHRGDVGGRQFGRGTRDLPVF